MPLEEEANPNQAQDNDEQLMLRVARGDKTAFEHLVARHQLPLVNFFRRMGVHNDGEDLAQETFVRIYRCRATYRPDAKFTTFLYLIARRLRIDSLRSQQRQQLRAEGLAETTALAAQERNSAAPEAARAVEALESLSDEMRSVVVLNIYQGLRYNEIAEVMEIPLGTVKTRMFHALRKLREVMNNGNK